MKRVKLPDFTMAYDELGSGVPVLLVHGYPLNRMMWGPQLEDLSGIAHLIAPDLRGHGISKFNDDYLPPSDGYTMDMLAEDCATLLDKRKIEEPIVFCGLSMGGYVAFAFYHRYPERVRGLILAATRAGPDSDATREARGEAITTAVSAGTGAIVEAMLPNMLSSHTFTNQPETVQRVADMMSSTPVDAIVGDLRGMMDRPDFTPMLEEIDVPSLIIFGADDKIINLWEMNNLRELIPGAKTKFISYAGHLPNLEQADIFNQEVRSFLSQFSEQEEDEA